jgi:nucleoside phosphorylase
MDSSFMPVHVCVVCALPEEAAAFLAVARQQGRCHTSISTRYGYSSYLIPVKNSQREQFTLHLSWPPGYGPQEMVLHLSHVLQEYQPLIVMMTGLCAGDRRRVRLGDLVVADRLFAYDSGKVCLDEQGQRVYEPDIMTYQPSASLLHYAGLFDGWQSGVRRLERPADYREAEQEVREVHLHLKPMASGSAVRADRLFEQARILVRGTVAIDMEGAAFGLVMSRYPLIPWLVVKGVCDYADQDKDDRYHDYAARVAALYTLAFLQAFLTRTMLLAAQSCSCAQLGLRGCLQAHHPILLAAQNRARMEERLQDDYHQLLLKSLAGSAWIQVDFLQKPCAVSSAAQSALRFPDQPESVLPSGTTILQVYTAAQMELLLLGQPGSGKSTLLISLALELTNQARQDTTLPLPFILPLSTWAGSRQTIQDWSKAQIAQIYRISGQVCEQWMQQNQLLLLLDGLDEMEEMFIPACIDAINAYRQMYPTPLVVCARETEYLDASKRKQLFLHQAVVVQPLTSDQIDRHLAQASVPLGTLRKELQTNSDMRELATTPLLLHILMHTYDEISMQGLTGKGKSLQEQVIDRYVERMIGWKGNTQRYSRASVIRWLGWLARQLRQRSEKIFYLEKLQPDWLPQRQQRAYTWLAVWLPGVLIGVLAGLLPTSLLLTFVPGLLLQYSILSGFLGGVCSISQSKTRGRPQAKKFSQHVTPGRVAGSALLALVWGIVFLSNLPATYPSTSVLLLGRTGVISGLAVGLCGLLLMVVLPLIPIAGAQDSRLCHIREQALRSLLAAGLFGTSIWLSDMVGEALSHGMRDALSSGVSSGLSTAFDYAFLSSMVSVIVGRLTGNIQLTERLKWTRQSLSQSVFNRKHICGPPVVVLIGMICFGLAQGSGPWLSQGIHQGVDWALDWGLRQGLGWGLSCALLCWLVCGLFQGISQVQVEEQKPRLFNQGIRDSLSNSVRMSLISVCLLWPLCVLGPGLGSALSYGLLYAGGSSRALLYELSSGFSDGLQQGLASAWIFAGSGSLLIGLTLSGGLAVLRHSLLRYLLHRENLFPWQARPFLEDVGQRNLFRCIDGKYSFPHAVLQDYFADYTVSPLEET